MYIKYTKIFFYYLIILIGNNIQCLIDMITWSWVLDWQYFIMPMPSHSNSEYRFSHDPIERFYKINIMTVMDTRNSVRNILFCIVNKNLNKILLYAN